MGNERPPARGDAQRGNIGKGKSNVTEADIYARLTPVFQEVFGDDDLVINPQLTADDVPEWDSMSHVRLMLTVERAFDTRFAAAEIAGLKNVGELVSLIQRHQA